MATVQRISSDAAPPASGRHVLVKLGDRDALEREGENYVYTVNCKLPRNMFEARAERIISDAELMADQEKSDVVFVCFDPRLRE
jgi:hypothetical protein